MKEIIVKCQEDFDSIRDVAVPTRIKVVSGHIVVKEIPVNCRLWLYDSSSVVLYDSSSAELYGSSSVELYDSSRAVLYDSSRAELWGSSRAVLWNSSRAVLRDSSSADLWDSSSAELWGSSRAELWGSSRAKLWGSSSAVLWNSSRAELWGSSRAKLWGSSRAVLRDSSRARLWGSSRAVLRDSSSAVLWGSSRAKLWGSSSAVLWNSSSAELWGSSKAICYMTSVARVNSGNVSIEAFDDVTVYEHERPRSITKSELVNLVCPLSDPKFDEWIERGWIVADGIRVKYLSHRQVGGAVLYKGETFDKRDIFVARAGEKFAHGDTPEQAVSDLRFKIADRDTSRFKNLAIDKRYPVEDLIEAYRVITGACETGVKMFCEKIKLNEEYTIKEVLKLTKDQYGHSEFRNFFGVKQ